MSKRLVQLSPSAAARGSNLPAATGTPLDLGFGGGEDDYWYFGMYAISSGSEPPLLEGAITGSCVGEGPRSEYLLQ